jgi:hypothetical protein
MTNGVMKADSLSIKCILSELATHPGLTVQHLSARTGMSVSYVHKCLRFSVHHNLLGCVPLESDPTGKKRGWYTAADLPAVSARWDQIAGQRAAVRSQIGIAKLRDRRESNTPEMGANPVHRIVKAGSKKPLPFQVRAARSVFDLGAA